MSRSCPLRLLWGLWKLTQSGFDPDVIDDNERTS
jgi:hypothetical protein